MQRVSPIFALSLTDADIVSEKFLKRVIGQTDLEDGMKTLDKLTNEEVVMAIAQNLKVTYNIDKNMTEVNEGMRRVDENVKGGVQLINDNIQAVNDNVRTMAAGRQRLFSESPASSLIIITQTRRQAPRK